MADSETQRIKRLERVRRDFVANVSHELKTPITSIKGFVETLQDGAKDNKEDLDRFLDIISVQADRLQAIIEDLLALSRIENEEEQGAIVLEPCKISDVIAAAITLCRGKADKKKVQINVHCLEDYELNINAPILEQAVVNLVDNAVKYSPEGAEVRVNIERMPTEIVLAVKDVGSGIPEEHLPRLFERFYRVDKARSRKLGGTGLGLAIVKHIALAHKGQVSVESEVDKGSTFKIHLPFN